MCVLPIILLAYIQDSTFHLPLQLFFSSFLPQNTGSFSLTIAFFTIYDKMKVNIMDHNNCIQAICPLPATGIRRTDGLAG
jgi:hypothetical protein